jgi:hypothetical protein
MIYCQALFFQLHPRHNRRVKTAVGADNEGRGLRAQRLLGYPPFFAVYWGMDDDVYYNDKFVWSRQKNARNKRKHNISFEKLSEG